MTDNVLSFDRCGLRRTAHCQEAMLLPGPARQHLSPTVASNRKFTDGKRRTRVTTLFVTEKLRDLMAENTTHALVSLAVQGWVIPCP
jgi:hypothetical protein